MGKPANEHAAAQHAVAQAVLRAEALIDDVMAETADRRSREAMSDAIQAHMEAHGEPRFRIKCYRCGGPVVDLPLAYPSARGLWTWMPPAYYVARFNANARERRCDCCGTVFPTVDIADIQKI